MTSHQTSDDEDECSWIGKAIAGDGAAMDKLIASLEQPVLRFLYARLGDESDAADCAQEVFVKVARSISSLREEARFRAWLFSIARNEMRNWIRKNRSRVVSFSRGDEGLSVEVEAVAETGPDVEVGRLERIRLVRACVETLPDAERDVLALRLDEEITFREIAEILDRPLNTVLGQMRNATKRLEQCLRAKGITP